MTPQTSHGQQLPVSLPPVTDELLSSWISRNAAFYSVPPITLLQHFLPEVLSPRAINLRLTDEQATCLAHAFRTDRSVLQRMSFTNIPQTSHRLIAVKAIQSCLKCILRARPDAPEATRRSQLLGWRLTCSQCGSHLLDATENDPPSPFCNYREDALKGQQLIDDEAERGVRTWASPTEIARLLLMRRDPRTASLENATRFKILGVVIPEIDPLVAENKICLPSAKKPILPLHVRPALMAGVAIVERHGPDMLAMLWSKTIGQNHTRFGELIASMLSTAEQPDGLSLLQHM